MRYRVSYAKTMEVCGDALIDADSLEELAEKLADEDFVDFEEEDEGGCEGVRMIGEPTEVSQDRKRVTLRA